MKIGKAGTLAEDVALASMAVLLAVIEQLVRAGIVDLAALREELDRMIVAGGDEIGRGVIDVLSIFSTRMTVEKKE